MKELRAGMLLGALAGALAGTVETIDVIGRHGQLLFGPGAGFSLTAQILFATITAGAILGVVLGALAQAVVALGSGSTGILARAASWNRGLLASRSRDARLCFLLALVAAAGLSIFLHALSRLFLNFPYGPRQLLPHALVATGCVALGILARAILGPRGERPGIIPLSAFAWSVAFLSSGAFALLYVIDRDYYARLYNTVHLGLATLAFGAACALLLSLASGLDTTSMRFPRRIALVLAALWLVTASASLALYRSNEDVKAFLYNRTTWTKRIYPLLARGIPIFAPRPFPVGAASPRAASVAAEALSPDMKGANVILITMDAVRADHLGVYGSARTTTPSLDRFGRKSVVFRRAYAQGANTFPSFSSLMTGRLPSEVKWEHPFEPPLPGVNLTLAEILDGAGYDTAAVTPHPYFDDRWGLPQGFEQHDNSPAIYNHDNRGVVSARVERKSEAMLAGLRSPFFFWAHFYDPHAHYMPRPVNRFGDRDVDLYDGELADTDAQIGRLLRWIHAHVQGPVIIVICADHGEEFGEHGGQYHGTTLYEETIHVPLLIRVPGVRPRLVQKPVSLVDVLPTLLDLLRIREPEGLAGRSLGPVFAGRPPPDPDRPVLSEATQLAWKRMAMRGQWKLVRDDAHDTWELYDLARDPRELRNRYRLEPERVRDLKEVLRSTPGTLP